MYEEPLVGRVELGVAGEYNFVSDHVSRWMLAGYF
jgi:hypothetical protein